MDESPLDEDPSDGTATLVRPKKSRSKQKDPPKIPKYNVVLWNDEQHSYDYVIRMLKELFGHPKEEGERIATTVDTQGRAIVLTTTKEHAELKRDQIHAYGRDEADANSAGSMTATIEESD